MGSFLNYEKLKEKGNRPVSQNEKDIKFSKDFPNCKGLYPDCPENPSLTDRNCRTCPKTDGIKKPKIGEE